MYIELEQISCIKIISNNNNLVVCPTVFILSYEQGWQGGVFKVKKKKIFIVFSVVSRLRSDLC